MTLQNQTVFRRPTRPVLNLRMEIASAAIDSLGVNAVRPLCALEIGCMFKRDEGLSTLQIVRHITSLHPDSRLLSIEFNPEHIEKCKEIFRSEEESLLGNVDFHQGHSAELLPKVLEDIDSVDFALIDGGGHPEVNLEEYEIILQKMSDIGILVVDDAHEFDFTKAYPHTRAFGKASLILPLLMLEDYLGHRVSEGTGYVPRSELICSVKNALKLDLLRGRTYCVFSQSHASLVVATKEQLESINDALQSGAAREAQTILKIPIPTSLYTFARKVKRILMPG